MRALETAVRKQLSDSVLAARRASESASRAAIAGLGVFDDRRPGHLREDQAALRNGLRAKWRQLGRAGFRTRFGLHTGPAVVGNGYDRDDSGDDVLRKHWPPSNWFAAVDRFHASALMRDYLGDRFV